jgi:hypothetical protein
VYVDLNCSRYAIALFTSAFIINSAHQISKCFAAPRLHLLVLRFVNVSGEPERLRKALLVPDVGSFLSHVSFPPLSANTHSSDSFRISCL